MALRYKTRKRLALLILFVGLPAYIMLAVTVVTWFDRPSFWLELLVYVVLGIAVVFPLRSIFRGLGRPDPDAPPPEE